MKKIKILHMPLTNSGSGVSQYVLQNWRFIDQSRFRFDFATRSKSLDFADEVTAQGCKIHYLSCSSEEDEEQFKKEMHRILDEGYDAIHLHTSYWKGYLVEELAIERGVPIVIVHSHSTMIDIQNETNRNESIKKHHYYRDTIPVDYGTHFLACSRAAADWLFGDQIPKNQIRIFNNAIDLSEFSFSPDIRAAYRAKLDLDGCFVMGHIGRFTYSKNHAMLIEIFREIYQKMPNARLMLVGSGELEPEIRQRVQDYGLTESVIFLGKRTDVPQLLQAMDVFLLPSRFEGLGLVLIEAQAAGLKCLASKSVPLEAQITTNLEFINDEVSNWVQQVCRIAVGYERVVQDRLIEEAGYDLRKQIKVIEKLYAGEDVSADCKSVAQYKLAHWGGSDEQ
ncbi:glycosyltransferase [Cohnella panacarvi]|uniref:glycosyltransferase n=1 Tax=Cohnella panacarvi TaxID=400776 RepID=UPI00047EB4AF|nr:glycosyltransferase [Cohnella panacarvi]